MKKRSLVFPSERARISQTSIIVAFDWFDERLYRGIFNFAKERGWHLSPYFISEQLIPRGWPADGAITCFGPPLEDFVLNLNMPVVDMTIAEIPRRIPRVVVDNTKIAEMAAAHFYDRGYAHFAYYSWKDVPVNSLRREAFFSALKRRGVPAKSVYEISQSPGTILRDWEAHQRDILDKLRPLPRPLAVFAGQDNLGAALIEIAVRNGIHVPEEIAVLGADNIDLLCEGSIVPLSSVRTNLTEVGYRAAAQLERLMRGEIDNNAPLEQVEPVGIVARRSTDALAVDHPKVVSAIRFIRENLEQPITIEDICAYYGLSKRGLEKAFDRHLNRSPASELRRLRIQNAKRMLAETDEKIEYIARCSGYSNSSNLSFALKKDSGLSPREYRKRYSGRA